MKNKKHINNINAQQSHIIIIKQAFKMSDNKPEKLCVVYNGKAIIGWCQTWQEADYICEKMSTLQWEIKSKLKVPQGLSQIIASEMCTHAHVDAE